MSAEYDFDVLDKALADLAEAANDARVAFICSDDQKGRQEFFKAISALARASAQLRMKDNN